MKIKNSFLRFALFSFFFLLCSFVFAQTAAEMDAMLQTEALSAARAARFVLEAADLVPAGISNTETELSGTEAELSDTEAELPGTAAELPGTKAELSGTAAEQAAYNMAFSNGWIKIGAEEPITLKDTAFLIMKAFNLEGGVMYSLFKNPRYAYREMVYLKLIPGVPDQSMNVSGQKLLVILDRTLNYIEEGGVR